MIAAWCAAVAACAMIASRAWKRTQAKQTVPVKDFFGRVTERSRWILWAPLCMVGLAGAGVVNNIHMKGRLPPIAFCLFFMVWVAFATLMTRRLADKIIAQEPRS
jgi:drug/metabolite transporter (DMT)-like permease